MDETNCLLSIEAKRNIEQERLDMQETYNNYMYFKGISKPKSHKDKAITSLEQNKAETRRHRRQIWDEFVIDLNSSFVNLL